MKLHSLNVVASEAKLPHLMLSTLSRASEHDYEVLKNDLLPLLKNAKCYFDSANPIAIGIDEANQEYYEKEYNVTIHAIEKKEKRTKRTLC